MTCAKSDEIGRWLLGTLDAAERADLLEHGHSCTECGPEIALLASLHGALAPKDPPVGAVEAVLRSCGALRPRTAAIRWRTVGAIYSIAAAALLFLAFHAYQAVDEIRDAHAARRELLATGSVRSLGVIVELRGKSQILDNRSLVEACEGFPFGTEAVRDGVFYDPWDRAYIFEEREAGFAFYSRGANGIDERGTGDDIAYEGSWDS